MLNVTPPLVKIAKGSVVCKYNLATKVCCMKAGVYIPIDKHPDFIDIDYMSKGLIYP